MGKAKKEHRKKVAKRNEKIATQKKQFQKQYSKLLEEKLKELQTKLAEKQNLENDLKVTVGGQELGFTVVDPKDLENTSGAI
jgi:hypothetical protein